LPSLPKQAVRKGVSRDGELDDKTDDMSWLPLQLRYNEVYFGQSRLQNYMNWDKGTVTSIAVSPMAFAA
jgi:hypothetical protein